MSGTCIVATKRADSSHRVCVGCGSNCYCGCGYKGELRTFSSVLRQHENAMMQAKLTTKTLQKTAGFLAGFVASLGAEGRRK